MSAINNFPGGRAPKSMLMCCFLARPIIGGLSDVNAEALDAMADGAVRATAGGPLGYEPSARGEPVRLGLVAGARSDPFGSGLAGDLAASALLTKCLDETERFD